MALSLASWIASFIAKSDIVNTELFLKEGNQKYSINIDGVGNLNGRFMPDHTESNTKKMLNKVNRGEKLSTREILENQTALVIEIANDSDSQSIINTIDADKKLKLEALGNKFLDFITYSIRFNPLSNQEDLKNQCKAGIFKNKEGTIVMEIEGVNRHTFSSFISNHISINDIFHLHIPEANNDTVNANAAVVINNNPLINNTVVNNNNLPLNTNTTIAPAPPVNNLVRIGYPSSNNIILENYNNTFLFLLLESTIFVYIYYVFNYYNLVVVMLWLIFILTIFSFIILIIIGLVKPALLSNIESKNIKEPISLLIIVIFASFIAIILRYNLKIVFLNLIKLAHIFISLM